MASDCDSFWSSCHIGRCDHAVGMSRLGQHQGGLPLLWQRTDQRESARSESGVNSPTFLWIWAKTEDLSRDLCCRR